MAEEKKETKRIVYGSMDGEATILVYFPDGRMHAYSNDGEGWKTADAADVFTKAAVLDEAQFAEMYPEAVENLPVPA